MKIRIITSLIAILLVGLAACGEGPKTTEEATALSGEDREAYLLKGKSIAQATFAELSGHLSRAMEDGGVENALRYCNVAAYPLADSLSQVHNADIRRTSLKVRNPKDKPTERELAVLKEYHEQAAQGEELQARVEEVNGQKIAFYAPINIQALCLNCHGKVGAELSEDNYALIRSLYPEDEATGYELGELRGMWSITFEEEL